MLNQRTFILMMYLTRSEHEFETIFVMNRGKYNALRKR